MPFITCYTFFIYHFISYTIVFLLYHLYRLSPATPSLPFISYSIVFLLYHLYHCFLAIPSTCIPFISCNTTIYLLLYRQYILKLCLPPDSFKELQFFHPQSMRISFTSLLMPSVSQFVKSTVQKLSIGTKVLRQTSVQINKDIVFPAMCKNFQKVQFVILAIHRSSLLLFIYREEQTN